MGTTVREAFRAARKFAGMSQPVLSRATSWDTGHISKFENGEKGAGIDKLDEWLAACRVRLIPVPLEPSGDLIELESLSAEHRQLLVRLGRILPKLHEQVVDLSIVALVERFEREAASQGSDPSLDESTESTGHDSRASSA